MKRPIAIGLSPNLEKDDICLVLKNLFSFSFLFKQKENLDALSSWFEKNYHNPSFFFNSARSGLYSALLSLKIKKGDQVLVQAFTCVAVVDPVLWTGATPVFVDINQENLGMDPIDLEKKISKKAKAIILQHTFSLPAQIEAITKIAQKHNLSVIEDCAHGLKVKYKNQYLGSFADLSVFSFGRDKAVSSVSGGALLINNKKYLKTIEKNYQRLSSPSFFSQIKEYLHPLLMAIILPFYHFLSLGKILLFFCISLRILNRPVYQEEMEGKKPKAFPQKISPSQTALILNQLNKIERFNQTRRNDCRLYKEHFQQNIIKTNDYPLLRYPLLVGERDTLLQKAKKKKMILGNWYHHVVDPQGVDLKKIKYYHNCPKSQYVAQHIINLPTYPTLTREQINKVINFIKQEATLLK